MDSLPPPMHIHFTGSLETVGKPAKGGAVAAAAAPAAAVNNKQPIFRSGGEIKGGGKASGGDRPWLRLRSRRLLRDSLRVSVQSEVRAAAD